MKKDKIISALKVIYHKMSDDFLINRNFSTLEVISALEDYASLIDILESNNWELFGQDMLNMLGGIDGKYFGRGEFVSGFCPKIISYQESFEAQKALDSISFFIRRKMGP